LESVTGQTDDHGNESEHMPDRIGYVQKVGIGMIVWTIRLCGIVHGESVDEVVLV
jgi:hypothetical protein